MVGLSEQQIQSFVGHELSPDMKEDLLAYLQTQPTARSIARTPMNLEILRTFCGVMRVEVYASRTEGKSPRTVVNPHEVHMGAF